MPDIKNIYGLIGHPLGHSISPEIHNSFFKKDKINAVYLCFDVKPEMLKNAIDGIRALNIKGFNVTIPHKENIMKYLDKIDDQARMVGAVNTVINDAGFLTGYNTDVMGFIKTIENIDIESAAILGAGGAAKAIAAALIMCGTKRLGIFNRTTKKAADLCEILRKINPDVELNCGNITDIYKFRQRILINATPIGMWPNADLSPLNELPDGVKTVYDLIYNPSETKLLKMAKEKHLKAVNGLGMLLYQAIFAYKIWTGIDEDYSFAVNNMKKEGFYLIV